MSGASHLPTENRTRLREMAGKMVSTYCDAREAGGKGAVLWEKYDAARHAFDDALAGVYGELERLRPLLTLAKQYASECSECGGHGVCRRVDFEGTPIDDVPCEDCADIRAVINKAEGRV